MTNLPAQALQLSNLDKRHPAISHGLAVAYREAAQVCLGRHHRPPQAFNLTHDSVSLSASATWLPPSKVLLAAWNNEIDATEAAAYCISLAAVELTDGLYAVIRAETGSGADYYLAPPGTEPTDIENLIRLEVSGIDKATPQQIAARLKLKITQLNNGDSNTPGIASIVALDRLIVISASVP